MDSSLWKAAYDRAPPFARDVAVSAYGLVVERHRYGREFDRLLRDAIGATFATPAESRRIQLRRWEERVQPAVARVEAYGRRGLTLDELANLPILTKETVRAELGRFVHPAYPRSARVRAHTSGTTGAGFKFLTTRHAVRRQWAFWWRYRGWHGISRQEWCAVFGGRSVVPSSRAEPPFWHVNVPGRAVLFSQYHLTPERAVAYVAEIRRRHLRWIHGYPSFIALLAECALNAGVEPLHEVRWVTVGAENLLEHQRRAIRRLFDVEPRQHYGMAEGVANFSECPLGRLHVDEDYSIVELIPIPGGSGYRVVGTTLDNELMPLLRYDTGDVVTVDPDDRCTCGRSGRLVRSIDGRQEDYLVLSDGTRVGRVDHLFKDAVNVMEAQVVQSRPGDVLLRIVRGRRYGAPDEAMLRGEIQQRFGPRLRPTFEYVPALPRTGNGKVRLVVSELMSGRIAAPP